MSVLVLAMASVGSGGVALSTSFLPTTARTPADGEQDHRDDQRSQPASRQRQGQGQHGGEDEHREPEETEQPGAAEQSGAEAQPLGLLANLDLG
jgi:hypothetical protein